MAWRMDNHDYAAPDPDLLQADHASDQRVKTRSESAVYGLARAQGASAHLPERDRQWHLGLPRVLPPLGETSFLPFSRDNCVEKRFPGFSVAVKKSLPPPPKNERFLLVTVLSEPSSGDSARRELFFFFQIQPSR
jgi:hypothetical protein